MLALTDEGIARIAIAATRMPASARVELLRRFAAAAEADQNNCTTIEKCCSKDGTARSPRRSPAAEKQARYRANLRRGVAYVPLPVNRLILDYLVRRGLLPRDARRSKPRLRARTPGKHLVSLSPVE
jgi:hypothetical protein